MRRKRFLYLGLVLAVLLSGVLVPLAQPSVTFAAPEPPFNQSPSGTSENLTPTLVASGFVDSDNSSMHIASQWEVATDSNHDTNPQDGSYKKTAYNSGTDNSSRESKDVPSDFLDYSTKYWWHVRYQSNWDWSLWSAETSFTTVAAPQADFSADMTEVGVDQDVTFTDNSSGGVAPLTYQWDFGDGSQQSTDPNPTHPYSSPGTYTVTLTITDAAGGPNTETKTGYITVIEGLVAGFSADRTQVVVGQTVTFTNLTSGGSAPFNSYEWDFNNDGTPDSSAVSPTYAYTTAGTYTVVLTVSNPWDTDNETKPNYITVSPVLQAGFNADKVVAGVDQPIQFTDLSAGGVTPLTYEWDFGDSSGSTAQHPTHSYSSAGTYTVVLTVTDSAGNPDTETKTDYITTVPFPVISDVTATSITATGATIAWTTDDLATSQVEFGTGAGYGSITTLDAKLVTSHSVTLTGLTSYLTYHYKVKSSNVSGFGTESADFTFTTTDDTPPKPPAVTDDGASTTSLTELHATWTSSDPQSGIAEYQYAIGTTAGGTDVAGWTSVGTNTEVTRTGLTLAWGTAYYFSVKAKNGQGAWSSVGSSNGIQVTDATPPSTPVVTDDGGSTTSTTQLHATWTCNDPESGIEKYQYAIGATAGGTDVVGWTSVGVSDGVTRTGLKLIVGVTYYFSVRAKNADGLLSGVGVSDGILVAPQGTGQGDISAAGGTVQTGDGKITAVFPADAVAGTVTVAIEQIAPPSDTSTPEGFKAGNAYFVIEVTDASGKAVVAFAKSIVIRVEYSEADVAAAGGDPDNLVLAYWDEAAGEWKVLETKLNTASMTLGASTSHLSTWAVLARTTPAASGGIPPLVWLLCLIGVVAVVVPAALILARKRFYLQD